MLHCVEKKGGSIKEEREKGETLTHPIEGY